MSIVIKKQGVLDTIQDLGRNGFAKWGINPSGVMDQFAAMAANALVGNDFNVGVMELHFPTSQFYFSEPAIVSITGGDFSAKVNEQSLPMWKPIGIPSGSTLSFASRKNGFRSYLAIRGGFDLIPWLGSSSTNLKIGAGGTSGGALRVQEEIRFRTSVSLSELQIFPWSINWHQVYTGDSIGFLPDEAFEGLSPASRENFLNEQIRILPRSDRMACYFDNAPLELTNREEMLSSAVTFGTIQILPSGKIVCLMADHQTTGGYPRLGCVIAAHLPRLAQTPPGSLIRFFPASMEDAEKQLFSLRDNIRVAATALSEKLGKTLS